MTEFSVIENPQYCHIFDNSGWQVGRMLTMENKDEFIHLLLCEDLLTKRLGAICNLGQGLNYFGMVDMIKLAPKIGEQLFRCEGHINVTAQNLNDCIEMDKPSKADLAILDHLIAFIERYENETGK